MAEETSLKGIIQGMMFDSAELMQGVVVAVRPLKIQMVNDEKLMVSERVAVVPWHLTDYETEMESGNIQDWYWADEPYNTIPAPLEHTHALGKIKVTVKNALKVGETVHVLSLNKGKLYYVLDRVVS